MSIKELLAVLHDEVVEAEDVMRTAAHAWRDATGQADVANAACTSYVDQVTRVHDVAEMLELTGIETLCDVVQSNVLALADETPEAVLDLLAEWPQHLLEYLAKPHDQERARRLVEHLASAHWPMPMDEHQRAETFQHLCSDIERNGQADEPTAPMQPVSGADDLSLELPGDLHPQLIESFLMEAPRHASHYSSVIAEVARGQGGISAIDEARRVIHTLKGAASTIGVRAIAAMTHHTEDILEALVRRDTQPDPALAALLVRIADCIESMVGSLLGEEPAPEDRGELLQAVLDVAGRLDGVMAGVAVQGVPEATVGEPGWMSALSVPEMTLAEPLATAQEPRHTSADAAAPVQKMPTPKADSGQQRPEVTKRTAMLNVPTAHIDRLARVAGEITIRQGRIRSLLGGFSDVVDALQRQNLLLREHAYAMEQLVDVQGVSAGRSQGAASTSEGSDTFDALEMDRYNELHSHSHAFIESFADFNLLTDRVQSELETLKNTFTAQTRMQDDLQGGLLESRMVPAARICDRLKRAVRHTGHQTGKDVAISISGEDVLVDSYVLGELAEPLIHLIRNAIDHGIESPEERARLGKSPQGAVEVRFAREGDKVVIRCQDDGRGLDYVRLREKALSLGLMREDENPSEGVLANMILQPGFSTAAEVTPVSGRGVGMDIVNSSVQQLKGSLGISSRTGQGAVMTLRLPLTLGVVHAMLIEVAQQTVAIPVDAVKRVVHGGTRHIAKMGSEWIFRIDDTASSVKLAGDLFAYAGQRALEDDATDARPVLLVNGGTAGLLALVVDRVLDADDLVLKQPGRYLENIPGLIGISVLGDGHVVPLVDAGRLLLRSETVSSNALPRGRPLHNPRDEKDILVVDDSLSVRNSLSQMLNDAGYRVRTAKDGLEAADAIEARHPAAVLLDLEMPRMNGIELTEHLRGRQATKSLPIVMITSRSQDKHRKRAQEAGVNAYLTKPYQELEVLDLLRRYAS
ncbi:hybrid sensor histidine kinase/response regulator [Thiocystis violacea]|uniref:hybrid sensor histidine kinase/response regulator n=1 Tax=Thiocystis violacea TaxID=13725 RepID=UPI0019044E10|nr:response regulator [Thiocystis violacea]MBK1722952.1 hypothetical protein [Thiocystis violacea]